MSSSPRYLPGDVVDGHQWTGRDWIDAPDFPGDPSSAPPAEAPRPRVTKPWLALLCSILAAITVVATLSVAFEPEQVENTGAIVPTAPEPPESGAEPAEPFLIDFDPISLSGNGDAIERIAIPAGVTGPVIVEAQFGGSSNFVVWGLDSGLNLSELAINEIGAYSGSGVVEAATAALKIDADGPWTITVRSLADAPTFDGTASGIGGAVLQYTGKQGIATIDAQSTGNIAVWERTNKWTSKLLVNEIAPYSGQFVIGAGPGVLIIETDGEWKVTVE